MIKNPPTKFYQAVKLHARGLNKHSFWSGNDWADNDGEGICYTYSDDAAKASKENGGKGAYISIWI